MKIRRFNLAIRHMRLREKGKERPKRGGGRDTGKPGSDGQRSAFPKKMGLGVSRRIGKQTPGKGRDFRIIGMSLAAALGIALLLTVLYGRRAEAVTELPRPEAGEQSRRERLLVETQEGELSYVVEIPAGTYTEEAAEGLLLEAKELLPKLILGENASLEHVEEDLNLVTEIPGSPVAVRWSSDHPEYLQYDGALAEGLPEEGAEVALEAELTCQKQTQYYCTTAVVFPPAKEKQSWRERIAAALQEANAEENAEVYYLPDYVDNATVVWRRPGDNPALPAALLVLAGGVLLVAGRRQKEKERLQERKKTLLLAYPELVSRMVLYLGAGLSVRQTFIRMAASPSGGRQGRALQEELALTVQELLQGNGEIAAYQHFGERSGLSEYRALSTLLEQNVRKGNRELLPMLQIEARKAFKDRERQVKILGSEAGTKLLLPMVLLLMVVLLLVLFPAAVSLRA